MIMMQTMQIHDFNSPGNEKAQIQVSQAVLTFFHFPHSVRSRLLAVSLQPQLS